ncbi:MAG TPA: hypothetical protein VGA09_22025 [Candidatus Binatia bacterium]
MARDKFILCRNCDAIHHVTHFDKALRNSVIGGEGQESPAEDWRVFVIAHAGHLLEPLEGTGERYCPSGSALDPMGETYIEVTNGNARMLLKRTRTTIDEPVQFHRVLGRLSDNGTTIEIQEKEIKNEMKYHFSWAPHTFDDQKIACFVELFKEVVKDIDPRSVRASEYSYTDDNVSYAVLEDYMVQALLSKCAASFVPAEVAFIKRFVEMHRSGSDVAALVLRRQVTIAQLEENESGLSRPSHIDTAVHQKSRSAR